MVESMLVILILNNAKCVTIEHFLIWVNTHVFGTFDERRIFFFVLFLRLKLFPERLFLYDWQTVDVLIPISQCVIPHLSNFSDFKSKPIIGIFGSKVILAFNVTHFKI